MEEINNTIYVQKTGCKIFIDFLLFIAQLILAGDPNQLGPMLNSEFAENMGLKRSFLERLMTLPLYQRNETLFPQEKYNPLVVTKLVKSYRAHKTLLQVPSMLFYDNELVSCAAVEEVEEFCSRPAVVDSLLKAPGVPLLFCGVAGESRKERLETSWHNKPEVMEVIRYVKILRDYCSVAFEDIGIITPYRQQVISSVALLLVMYSLSAN